MRLSLNITDFSAWADPAGLGGWLSRITQEADASGLDTVWVSDHLLQADPGSSLDNGMLEAYNTLGEFSPPRPNEPVCARAYGDIEKTLSPRLKPDESATAFTRRCSEITALGIEHIVVIIPGPWTDVAVATTTAAARGY